MSKVSSSTVTFTDTHVSVDSGVLLSLLCTQDAGKISIQIIYARVIIIANLQLSYYKL